MRNKRITSIVSSLDTTSAQISQWQSSLKADGSWPDVDYTTGCAARRANWPAQDHWSRLNAFAAAWQGGTPNAPGFENQTAILDATLLGMKWWFDRDFTNIACLDKGGTDSCPCSNTDNTLWNTNWFGNIIGVPSIVSRTCLLLGSSLPQSARDHCILMTGRSYNTFTYNPRPGYLSGANILDVVRIAVDQGLLTDDMFLLGGAYQKAHDEMVIKTTVKADGIRNDGSFGQHTGLLYNGNYGKDYSNDVVALELIAAGTEFAANPTARAALGTLFDGDQWMAFFNSVSKRVFWDLSVIPRFISFPVGDGQASGSLGMNLADVRALGSAWSSAAIQKFASIADQNNMDGANAGKVYGNRMYYANDYMVQRGAGYVSTLKMYSSRTKNTECTNTQNPFGFHLSDGVMYTYQRGNEYEDIAAAWDWELIPGSTVDYRATPLSCDRAGWTGLAPFVGGVSTGSAGVAAMRYTNPYTKTLQWQKAWFFLPGDVQHVMVSNIVSTSGAPVYSVFDQKRHLGSVIVDGQEMSFPSATPVARPNTSSLWHDNVGYLFANSSQAVTLNVQVGRKQGDWSKIGTSTAPPVDVDLFSAWLQHDAKNLSRPIAYTTFPNIDRASFLSKIRTFSIKSNMNDAHVSAVYYQPQDMAMMVFWDAAGGTATLDLSSSAVGKVTLTVQANGNAAVIYDRKAGRVYVSDPSQSRDSVQLKITTVSSRAATQNKTVRVTFPRDGTAGSTQSAVV
ncbi:polysaccharide lyase family 8 protein [Cylindrobasidium torrendii FP15055 ss-10]|uniref:Polysaccharide lyase family 8 protein n=1 Tax=Cylindrobasidium torrendii FP15055 ss-10 TaxID=1314674 RepID=A0A0D7BN43_9AGAR|nr:polysaccharide lyase family 8 protein [Cylindrobasidium torrendii FP15055 ss-10]